MALCTLVLFAGVQPVEANSAPQFAAESVSFTIAEDHEDGASVGTVTASDADGDELVYALSGDDAGLFALATGDSGCQGLRLVQDCCCYPRVGNEVPLQVPLYQFVSQHGPLVAGRAKLGTGGFQQSVDECYSVLNGVGIDEHAVIRDDPQETGYHHGWQNKGAVPRCAGVSGIVEPGCRNDMVLMVGSECHDQYVHIRNHRSVASRRERLQEPSMPGRKPPRRRETGNGFIALPRGAVERRRRISASSTTAASVVRSLAACARAWASNSSRMSTVAFTMVIVPRGPAGVFGDRVEQAGHADPPMSFGKSDAHEPFGCLGNDRRDPPAAVCRKRCGVVEEMHVNVYSRSIGSDDHGAIRRRRELGGRCGRALRGRAAVAGPAAAVGVVGISLRWNWRLAWRGAMRRATAAVGGRSAVRGSHCRSAPTSARPARRRTETTS